MQTVGEIGLCNKLPKFNCSTNILLKYIYYISQASAILPRYTGDKDELNINAKRRYRNAFSYTKSHQYTVKHPTYFVQFTYN